MSGWRLDTWLTWECCSCGRTHAMVTTSCTTLLLAQLNLNKYPDTTGDQDSVVESQFGSWVHFKLHRTQDNFSNWEPAVSWTKISEKYEYVPSSYKMFNVVTEWMWINSVKYVVWSRPPHYYNVFSMPVLFIQNPIYAYWNRPIKLLQQVFNLYNLRAMANIFALQQ